MRPYTIGALVPLVLLAVAGTASARTLRVPQDVPLIQSAIYMAYPGDVIEVDPIGSPYRENLRFMGMDITVRATDPDPAKTIIDGQGLGSVVTFEGGEGPGAVLQGFTITNGSGTPPPPRPRRLRATTDANGGGIYCSGASPTIVNNVIANNAASAVGGRGGGIMCRYGANPTIQGNSFIGNSAQDGGGIAVYDGSSPLIQTNTFTNNKATYGGGIWVQDTSRPVISDNGFDGNSATGGGGAISLAGASPLIDGNGFWSCHSYLGGAVFIAYGAAPKVSGNVFIANTAYQAGGDQSGAGGAIWADGADGLTLSDNNMYRNAAGSVGPGYGGAIYASGSRLLIAGNRIEDNTAGGSTGGWGGGLCLIDVANTSTAIRNLITTNTASSRGGGIYSLVSDLRVENNTISGNAAPDGGGGICSTDSSLIVTNSIVAFSGSGGGIFVGAGETRPPAGKVRLRPRPANGTLEPVVTYCDVFGNQGGDYVGFTPPSVGNLCLDPLFVYPYGGNYRLQSRAGHYEEEVDDWIPDDQHSPCIDAGDPNSDYSQEPQPNGNRINMGYDGNTPETSLSFPRPDMMVRNLGETAWTGAGIYDSGPGQTRQQTVPPGTKAVYQLRLANAATVNDRFRVLGGQFGRYFDALVGGKEITGLVTKGQWQTKVLAPGEGVNLRVEVIAANTPGVIVGGSVTGISEANPDAKDSVGAFAHVASVVARPDMMIRNAGETEWAGNDVYDTHGTGQSVSQQACRGTTAVYELRAQNDGKADDRFTLTGAGGDTSTVASWQIRYFDKLVGGKDITDPVVHGRYKTPSLKPQATFDLRVEVTPLPGGADAGMAFFVSAASNADRTKQDVVAVNLKVAPPRPDLLIRRLDERRWAGNNVYNGSAAGQTKEQRLTRRAPAVYLLRVQNDSDAPDRFSVLGTGGTAKWQVRYFSELAGGTDVTAQVASPAGWPVGPLGPAVFRDFRVEVTPPAGAPADQAFAVDVRGVSVGDAAARDVVRARTTYAPSGLAKPDLMIRAPGERLYLGRGLCNTTGAGQTRERSAAQGVRVVYELRVENVSPDAGRVVIRSTGAGAGWQVRFFDSRLGGVDITDRVVSPGGWPTAVLDPGAACELRLEISALASVPAGGGDTVAVAALPRGRPAADVVKAVTTCVGPNQPDLLIGNPTGPFVGGDLYNLSGLGQTKSQTASPGSGVAIYQVLAQNDAAVPDRLKITGVGGDATVRVRYFDARMGGHDITSQVTGWGWVTPSLAPAAMQAVRVEVTPLALSIPARTFIVTIAAKSVAQPRAIDVVRAATVCGEATASAAQVSGLAAIPSAAGAQITFSLSAPADVDARILNLAGRAIRTLCRGQACDGGTNTLLWNAQSDDGLRVPSGTYLVEVSLTAADGAKSRAVAMVRLER